MSRTRFIPLSALLLALAGLVAPRSAFTQEPLPEEFISTTGNLTLYYPAGWSINDEDGIIALTNDPVAFGSERIPKGAIGVLVIEPQALSNLLEGIDAPTLPDVGAALADLIRQSEDEFELDSIEEITIADQPAVRVEASTETDDVVIYVIDHGGDALVAVMGVTAAGEQPPFADTLLAIAASIEYIPAWHAILLGHTAGVRAVAFSPNGTLVASGSDDGTARVWSVDGGPEALRLKHPDAVSGVAFSPDGTLIVTGGADGLVRLWDAATGAAVAELSGHTDEVRAVAFGPNGALIASSSDDQTIRLWAFKDGWQEQAALSGHVGQVQSVAFSPDGARLASSGEDRTARVWDVISGTETLTIEHPDQVRSVAFGPGGAQLVTGCDDGSVRVWDAASGVLVAELAGHTEAVRSVAISADGLWIASGGDDQMVRLWVFRDGWQEHDVLSGHGGPVRTVAFSPDGALAASGSDDLSVILWEVPR